MKSIFKISGMTCNGCKSSVEDKLSSLDGVDDVQVDLNKGEAVIKSKKLYRTRQVHCVFFNYVQTRISY